MSKVFDAGVGDAHRRRNTGWKNQVGEGEREREEVFIGTRKVSGGKNLMVIWVFDVKELLKCFVMETINFDDLRWGINLRFRSVEYDGLNNLRTNAEFETL